MGQVPPLGGGQSSPELEHDWPNLLEMAMPYFNDEKKKKRL
jgi:hypothetical protein